MRHHWSVCHIILALGFLALIHAAIQDCVKTSDCPAYHCCLEVDGDYICSIAPAIGESCHRVNDGINIVSTSEDEERYTGGCPCIVGSECVVKNATAGGYQVCTEEEEEEMSDEDLVVAEEPKVFSVLTDEEMKVVEGSK